VAKLGFVCSPSVMTGDPVASNFSIVSRTASLQIDSNSSRDKLPRSYCSKAVMTFCGRGMLPIGSVGIVISKPRKDSDSRQALPLLTIISHASRRLRTRLGVVEKVGGGEGGAGEATRNSPEGLQRAAQ